VIAFAVMLALGLIKGPGVHNPVGEAIELQKIGGIYHITALNLLPLALLAFLSIRKVPAVLALLASTLFAGVLGAFLQPSVMKAFVGGSDYSPVIGSVKGIWHAAAHGFTSTTGITDIDKLLSRGGMDSMLPTVWLIIGAVTFGALLEEFGLISRLLDPLVQAAKTTGRLCLTVFVCSFGLNIVAGDQYIALVLPSRMFRAEFGKRGLAPTNLSRLAADSGTVTSPLVPWNSCGAFMSAVLGVSTLLYLPFCVFNYASPLLSVLYGFTGFKIEKIGPSLPGAPLAGVAAH
jgi:NhaC family Na+:H+ antiporter